MIEQLHMRPVPVLSAVLAILATVGAATSQPAPDLAGVWSSNIGLTYTIVQTGTQVVWTASDGGQGTIIQTASGLTTNWSDATGPHTATSTTVERDAAGRLTRIAWSNGVVFTRAAGPAPAPPGLAPAAPAQQVALDLAGTWSSNIGLTYTIVQTGTQIVWTASNGGQGTIIQTASGLTTNWSDATGPHTATSTTVERDAAGRPTKIAWSNGVAFTRAGGQPAASAAATLAAIAVGAVGEVAPGMTTKIPKGPAPEIVRITPTEPDGKPSVKPAQSFTVFGNNLATSGSATHIGLMRYADPPPPIPPQAQDLVADVPVTSATADRLDAVMPAGVAPGTYLLWVNVDATGHSTPVSVLVWTPKPVGPIPTITKIDPAYPGLKALIHGSNFAPNSLVTWDPGSRTASVRYLSGGLLEATVPPGLKPGVVEVSVEVNFLRSAWFKTVVLDPKPLSLYWTDTDDNAMPLNPKWGWQLSHQFGSPDYYPNPEKLGKSWSGLSDQPVTTDTGWFGCGPHVNWMGVTYTGTLKWSSHSAPGTDDDYNFWLFPEEGAGATVRPGNEGGIQLEFDSDETIDHFHTAWWKEFHDAKAHQMIDGKYAIATGLMGLDCAHDCVSEVHPVWALAIHVKDDPADDVWAMFVRNWGNEGYCGTDQHFVQFNQLGADRYEYAFTLPWRSGAASVEVVATDFLTRVAAEGPSVTPEPGKGVRIGWILPHFKKFDRVNGSLRLKWTGGVQTSSFTQGMNLAAQATGVKIAEEALVFQQALAAVPLERQALFRQEHAKAVARTPAAPDLGRPAAPMATTLLRAARTSQPPVVLVEPDAPVLQRRQAFENTLRQAGVVIDVHPAQVLAPSGMPPVMPAQPPGPSAQPTINIAGHWSSSIHITYEIVQEGNTFTWVASRGDERAKGTLTGDTLEARWAGAMGPASAQGRVTSVDASGRAIRIEWSNGVVFVR